MRPILAVTGGVVVGLASAAHADREPAPAAPAVAAGARSTAGLSVAVWHPAGDIDEFANTSIGIRPSFTFGLRPGIAAIATFDWVFVDEKAGSGVNDITYYAISAGFRGSKLLSNGLEPYGELLAGYHKLETTGVAVDDGGIGLRLGGGVMYALTGTLIASAGLAFSTVSIDAGFFDVEVSAIVFDLGLGARF